MAHQIIQKIQKITIQGHGGTDWTQSMLKSAQAGPGFCGMDGMLVTGENSVTKWFNSF